MSNRFGIASDETAGYEELLADLNIVFKQMRDTREQKAVKPRSTFSSSYSIDTRANISQTSVVSLLLARSDKKGRAEDGQDVHETYTRMQHLLLDMLKASENVVVEHLHSGDLLSTQDHILYNWNIAQESPRNSCSPLHDIYLNISTLLWLMRTYYNTGIV